MSYVYVFDFGDMVKVGYTKNLEERKTSVQCAVKRKANRTFAVPAKIDVERLAHEKLGGYRIKGEYYRCSFYEACEAVKAATEEVENQAGVDQVIVETKFTMILDRELAQKLSYIAKYYGRSRTKEIEWACKEHIRKFEETVDKIELEDAPE